MALKLTNTSEKVIGVGELTVLPGETKEVPSAFETSAILEVYKNIGLITLSGKAKTAINEKTTEENISKEDVTQKVVDVVTEKEKAEKKAKLDSLKDLSDEEIAAIAKELGINPAECKDLADVRKKVKAALSK